MFKKIFKITLKVLMWIFISVFSIILIAILALQLPQSQKFLTNKAVSFLEKKIKTRVEVGGINIRFPKAILLKDIYVEDQKRDTLLYAHRIAVDVDFMGLISNKLEVNNIQLEKITGHVERTMPDSTFNFDFIIKAFASDNNAKTPKDTTKKGMEIKVMGLEMEEIYVTYLDAVTGVDMNVKLGEFDLEMDKFNLDKKEFIVDFIKLHNTSASLIQTKLPTSSEDTTSQPLELNLGLEKIDLAKINLKYKNQVNKQSMALNLGELILKADKIDLPKQKIDLKSLELNNTTIVYVQDKSGKKDSVILEKIVKTVGREAEQVVEKTGKPWAVNLGELKMVANNLKFDDNNSAPLQEGIDFKHLLVQGLGMNIQNINYSGLNVSADIDQLVFREKSGFRINEFQTKVRMDSTSAKLEDLNLQTGNSHLKNHLEIGFKSLKSIGEDIGKLKVNGVFDETTISFKDILYFQPKLALNLPFKNNESTKIQLTGKVNGSIENLNIPSFELKTLQSTVLVANGKIKGLPDIKKTFFDMHIVKLASTSKDIKGFLPPNTLPNSITLPSKIDIKADFKGLMNNFDANTIIRTSLGAVTAKVNMDMPVQGRENYKAVLNVNNFQLGKFLKKDSLLGPITLAVKVKGSGLSMKNMVAKIDAKVHKAVFKGYQYKGLVINGKVIQKEYLGKINYSDSNLVLAFNGDVNFNKQSPIYKFDLDLEGVNLKALNLSPSDLRFQTRIAADISGHDLNDMNGKVQINETVVIKEKTKYNVNSFLFATINQKRKTEISIESDILDAKFQGTLNPSQLVPALKQHINQYFSLNDPALKAAKESQNFNFSLEIKNSDLLTDVLVPGLERFTPGEFKGEFDSKANDLDFKVDMPEIVYSGIAISKLNFNLKSTPNKMGYELTVANITKDSTQIRNVVLGGDIKDDKITTRLAISDKKKAEKFVIGGLLKSVEKVFRFQFDEVLLNYDAWAVNEDNFLEFGGKQFIANNVKLQKDNQFLTINTINKQNTTPDFEVKFNEFSLAFISSILEGKKILVGGNLDGKVVLEKFPGGTAFTSDLKIQNFSFKEDTLGNISLQASNLTKGRYDVKFNINGEGNDVNLNGFYATAPSGNNFNLDLNIKNLNLATIEAYTVGQASKLSGTIKGDMKITGSATAPEINGSLNFQKAGVNVTYLNSYLLIDDEKINFDNSGIHFPSFTVKDEQSNNLTIDGDILTKNFRDFNLNLYIGTKSFRFLNTNEESNNKLFYGTVLVGSRITVKGTIQNPTIDAKIKLEKGTKFTFIVPSKDVASANQEGVVYFDDLKKINQPLYGKLQDKDTVKAQFKGMNLTATIDLDKDALFNIIIDKERGDILTIQGSTNDMLLAIDESGKTTLSGRYNIYDGNYRLSFYNLVKRDFKLQRGSSIVWSGDPIDARLDLAAYYTVKTSAANLSPGVSSNDAASKKKYPFQVYLKMKEELMKPVVSFDIKLEEAAARTQQTIVYHLEALNKNESDVNKQVFALLILGGFIKGDNLSTGNSGGMASTVRGSVSEVLSDQLNNLSGKYIKGVDLSVGIQSDGGSTAGNGDTKLNLGLSKGLFNDRVEVKVGSNIQLEGSSEATEESGSSTASNLVGDMSILYKITPDGIYKVGAFRETKSEQSIEGQVIAQGVTFVFTKEYDRLSELFKKRDEEKEEKEEPRSNVDTRQEAVKPEEMAKESKK